MTTLEQVVAALRKRGRDKDVFLYGFMYPLELMIRFGLSEDEALKMDVDDVTQLMSRPLESGSWDNFWVGSHYHARPAH